MPACSHLNWGIVAHEAIAVELSEAFLRAVEPEAKRNNASRAPRLLRLSFNLNSRSSSDLLRDPRKLYQDLLELRLILHV